MVKQVYSFQEQNKLKFYGILVHTLDLMVNERIPSMVDD